MVSTYLKFTCWSVPDMTIERRVPILNDSGMWLLNWKMFFLKKQEIHDVCWSRV